MMMDPLHRTGVLLANDLPTPMGDMYQSLYLLFRAVREHSTVALSGEVADEVFGGYWWFHDRSAIANDTFPWLFPRHPAAGGGNPIVELLDPGLAACWTCPDIRPIGTATRSPRSTTCPARTRGSGGCAR